jgi:hypothetical protein
MCSLLRFWLDDSSWSWDWRFYVCAVFMCYFALEKFKLSSVVPRIFFISPIYTLIFILLRGLFQASYPRGNNKHHNFLPKIQMNCLRSQQFDQRAWHIMWNIYTVDVLLGNSRDFQKKGQNYRQNMRLSRVL